jgi:hypothetical protein
MDHRSKLAQTESSFSRALPKKNTNTISRPSILHAYSVGFISHKKTGKPHASSNLHLRKGKERQEFICQNNYKFQHMLIQFLPEGKMKETSQNTRIILTLLAVVIGLFLIVAAPFIVQTSLERVLKELTIVMEEQPKYGSGIPLFSLFYPLWRAFGFVAGITLLAIAPSIYKGKWWTFSVALTAYAIPSIGGMFMFLPYISWVGGFPLPMVISWVGLAGFWTLIWMRKAERIQKLAQFLTFTFIGMLATHAFVIGIAAQRMLLTRPEKPLFAGIEWWILTLSGEVNWIAVVMLIVAIPLLALRKTSGWWLATIAGLSILVINVPTQILRTKTLDYLYGSLISVGLLISLFIPALKQQLIGVLPQKSSELEEG